MDKGKLRNKFSRGGGWVQNNLNSNYVYVTGDTEAREDSLDDTLTFLIKYYSI